MPKMRLLRSDLVVTPLPDASGCQIHDDQGGKVYEFGAVEQFLIEQFLRPYQIKQVCTDCNARFGLQYTSDDISDFLGLLADWDLLQEVESERSEENGSGEVNQEPANRISAAEHKKDLQQPNRWHLFNPELLLDSLCRALYPLRFMVWLIPLFFAIGGIAVMFNPNAFFADLSVASSRFGLLGRLALAAFTASFFSQVARGVVARYYGLPTPSFGLLMLFGLVPRFNVQIIPAGSLERETRLWLSATSTLVRLLLFGVAALLWAMTHASGSSLPIIGVELALLSIMSLVFIANPLWRGDGSTFLSALLDIPDIQRRSRNALLGLFFRQPTVIARYSKHRLVLGLIGLASLTFFLLVLGFIIYKAFTYLESHYQGAGVALFLLVSVYVSLTIRRQIKAKKMRSSNLQGKQAKNAQKSHGPWHTNVTTPHSPESSVKPSRTRSGRMRSWAKYALLLILVVCLFLPYQYETAGSAEILPSARITITPEADGIIEEVFFNGGEWVKASTVLARLADYKQLSELRQLEADIEAKKYEIEKNRTTPSAEEIRLAEEKIDTARQQAKYSLEKLKRQKELFQQGFISSQSFEDARNTAERDKQLLAEAEASLLALKVQINPNLISSLQAQIVKLQQEVELYQEQLRRTSLRTPIDGQIVTKDLQNFRNTYLEAGKVFAEIEDTRTVLLRVAVPEFDIGEVTIGAPLTFKLWAYPDREFSGTVTEIQPATEEVDYGMVVNVTSRLNNPDGVLISGLTGQAKIRGKNTVVLFAFTKALVRFVSIEVWSWLP